MLKMFLGHCVLGEITTGMLFLQVPARHWMGLSPTLSSSVELKKGTKIIH